MESEQPQWSAASSVPIARGTGTPRKRPSAWLAPTPRCGSHPHRAPFRRSAPSLEGETRRRPPLRQRVENRPPGTSAALAVRKVNNEICVGWAEAPALLDRSFSASRAEAHADHAPIEGTAWASPRSAHPTRVVPGFRCAPSRLRERSRQNSSGHGSTIAHRSGPLLRCFICEVSPPLRLIQRLTLSG